jgi:hypothetical protein
MVTITTKRRCTKQENETGIAKGILARIAGRDFQSVHNQNLSVCLTLKFLGRVAVEASVPGSGAIALLGIVQIYKLLLLAGIFSGPFCVVHGDETPHRLHPTFGVLLIQPSGAPCGTCDR